MQRRDGPCRLRDYDDDDDDDIKHLLLSLKMREFLKAVVGIWRNYQPDYSGASFLSPTFANARFVRHALREYNALSVTLTCHKIRAEILTLFTSTGLSLRCTIEPGCVERPLYTNTPNHVYTQATYTRYNRFSNRLYNWLHRVNGYH